MTTSTCAVRGEDLIAYADGYLAGARRELVEAHLRVCAHCQDRVAAFREVDRIIREGAPLVDDSAGRVALHAALLTQQARRPVVPWPLRRSIITASLLLLLAGLLTWPISSRAGVPLGRFIDFGPVRVERSVSSGRDAPALLHVATAGPSPAALIFSAVEPPVLPLGLKRVERSTPTQDRLELLYRNGLGMAVLVQQTPARANVVSLDTSSGEHGVTLVAGIEVLWLADPQPGAVSWLFWEREGVFFELMMTESPPDGLLLTDAERIVESLATAQDAVTK